MNLAPGTVLQKGKYKIDEVLGIGGFGITYRATHTYLGQTVAIKTLNDRLCQHPDFALFQQQFIAEAQRLSWCQHPNIVRLLDFFEEAGLSFIVMDYIPGESLAQLVKSGQPLSEAEALHYIQQIASALKALHQSGLLHRDIKPENIIRRAGTHLVMLIDFGIAGEFTPEMRQAHSSLLSSGYAPIEQYVPQGQEVRKNTFSLANSARTGLGKSTIANRLTPATDIYSLAATFYYLLTAEKPVAASLRDRVSLLSLRLFQPQLSPAIEKAIMWGLEIDIHNRPQTVEDWLAFLEAQQLLERQKQLEEVELCVFPSSSLILLVFVLTAGLAGWTGFDFARRYTGVTAMSSRPPVDRSFVPWENSQHPEFRSQDPEAPLFGEPSVQSSPNLPVQLNKPPKESSQNVTAQPTSEPVPDVAASPTPTPTASLPKPQPELAEPYIPEPEPELEQVPSYSPAPVGERPREPAIAPAPVPVPEVAPLPPEPPEPPTPTPAASEDPLLPEAAPDSVPLAPSQPEPEPLLPSLDQNSGEGSVRSQNPPNLEPVVPFPEPSSN
ncbi:MAG TPA: protein kinase [Kamptonema sp.]|nr:protein kinase [Kamptonema sp.]